jgi:hypothetical protein
MIKNLRDKNIVTPRILKEECFNFEPNVEIDQYLGYYEDKGFKDPGLIVKSSFIKRIFNCFDNFLLKIRSK